MPEIVGWDIGGVHTKAVWLRDGDLDRIRSASRPFEIWRSPEELPEVLREVYTSLGVGRSGAMAVTMTAELADSFPSKRQGVLFILGALRRAFPDVPTYLLSLSGEMEELGTAFQRPADFAAANWLASALFVSGQRAEGLLVDVGSTTTDITPIVGGRVLAQGRSDTARLAAGELVYSGVVRTNPNTIVSRVPIGGHACRVAAEYFTQMCDVYLLLGLVPAQQYTSPTPDGRSRSREDARRRLARLVCADGETLTAGEILLLARYLHERQLGQVSEALYQVLSRFPDQGLPLISVGVGRFLALEAGERLGLPLSDLEIPPAAAQVLPCLAVAYLLDQHLRRERG